MIKELLKRNLSPGNIDRLNNTKAMLSCILKGKKYRKYDVLIDTTNTCNLRCSFCTRYNNKVTHMTSSEFAVILSKIHPYTRSLQLSCAWEYSIAKNAVEIVKNLAKYEIPCTTIYTNGNVLPDSLVEALIYAKLNNFVVSIGEVKKETYEKIRKGGNFERVLANIRKLDTFKKEQASNYPRLCVNLTLIHSNIYELIDFIELAHDLGIEEIRGRHLILNEGLDVENEMIQDKAEANNIIESASDRAIEYGMDFFIPKYSKQIVSKSCYAPWHQFYIASNGEVSVCPRIHVYTKIGNLIYDDLMSIVKSSEIQELQHQFNTKDFTNPVCMICMANMETEIPINQGF